MQTSRSSAILLHITSLPSPYGIGDLGPSAYEFVDFLSTARQKYWQILPLTPTEFGMGNSPYSSPSAFAGNILVISPDELLKDGYIEESDLEHSYKFHGDRVEFEEVIAFKKELLVKAFLKFKSKEKAPSDYRNFLDDNSYWLQDYALFAALKAKYKERWLHWPAALRDRQPTAISEAESQLSETIEKEKFLQYLFFNQWQKLVKYAREKGVQFIGDIPFYVSHDSADCWARSEYFKLDERKQPTAVSGVPPDYFSETGQLWGTPVYDWDKLKQEGFRWWLERIKQNLQLFDMVRIDHFRAFSAYWEVPADDDTAINGKWVDTPGTEFFELLKSVFDPLPILAEDLGDLDENVHKLRDRFELPGMKVLLFAFGPGMAENPYIPHNHIRNSVVFTGTHDNNTAKGYYKSAPKEDRERIAAYTGRNVNSANVAEIFQRMALASVADLVIIPMQDVLGLHADAVMNIPGTSENNWTWRVKGSKINEKLAEKLKEMNEAYGRVQ